MDVRRTPAYESGQTVSLSVTSALVSAVLEWMLMFMIFIDASFAYLVTRFARRYQLQIPCLLCSRLDHVLGNERAGFYWDLICHKHKSKISSLVLCQLHNNLVDVHGTCESCFRSFAKVNKSHAETYRKCSCCNEEWVSRTCTQKLFRRKSINSEGAKHDAPSSITPKYNGDEVQNIAEESSQLGQIGNKDTDLLPHVEYSQIKVASDTESEAPFSDNESGSALIREMETSGQDSVAKYDMEEPQIIIPADCPATEKLTHLAPPIKFSLSDSEERTITHHNVESEAHLGHGLEELNWQQADHYNDVTKPSELLYFPDVHPSPNANMTHYVESKETNAASTTELEKDVHVEGGEASNLGKNSTITAELWKEVHTEYQENSGVRSDSVPVNEIHMDLKPNKTDSSLQMTESLDLGDAYKLALGTRGRQLSGRLLEQQRSMTDSTRASEDLKLLLSQISASRGIDLPLNDMSPKVSANSDDFKAMDASGAIGTQIFQRRISLERNESNLSLDESTVSEIEGESVVDRLKRQVEHDKKMLGTLYKELEEERNASAIAANQAMAMITRLQEEKAAFHMEALQCVRMMEEQAEYDSEALQKGNELLAEKEKQIQDFEFELELYRNQFGDVPSSNDFVKPRPESEADELKEQILEADCRENCATEFRNADTNKPDVVKRIDGAPKVSDGDNNIVRISLHQFEDEKQYILECLEKLDEKLSIFAKHEVFPDMIDGAYSTSEVPKSSLQENGGAENSHLQRDALMLDEIPQDLCGHENSQHENEGYGKFRSSQYGSNDVELASFRRELSVMNNRLGALEAEKNVMECSINALSKGREGFEFIREIAVRLQELHSAHIIRRNEDLT